ncbi:basic salivary proline-rich protein 2-like, partial [Etheostoma cragini]|uniref:basic salivary proline-rich protein 2-like n=1 Tax=Etheostoma cragini TaxID=417921 RepID=UPI00155EB432
MEFTQSLRVSWICVLVLGHCACLPLQEYQYPYNFTWSSDGESTLDPSHQSDDASLLQQAGDPDSLTWAYPPVPSNPGGQVNHPPKMPPAKGGGQQSGNPGGPGWPGNPHPGGGPRPDKPGNPNNDRRVYYPTTNLPLKGD